MASPIVENALRVGGEEFAKEVARFEAKLEAKANTADEEEQLNQRIRANSSIPESALEEMTPKQKREVAEEFEGSNSESTVEIPVAGSRTNSNTTQVNRDSNSETYTEEISIPSPGSGARGDDQDTIEVERERTPDLMEQKGRFNSEMKRIREERKREQKEREKANSGQSDDGVYTGFSTTNVDTDGSDMDIPEPGSGAQGDDDE
ncbi:hypothetical protein QA600_08535 [Natronococcus sp. A-GB1]|uniref:hypothetical protein n=1 Tax=Natronococcus sp. A-GB1 TaxID=3037648 RepID=UPI00241F616E|nr:hypothetical protein [Natronococcus sp. A-GB1]MDG5759387.1 hypothetical protein [Natronococcus sp. A-GB1]